MKTTTTLRRNLMALLFSLLVLAGANSINAQPPTITSFTPTSGSVGTLVTVSGTNLSSPTTFSIGGANAIVISNTGTSLVGMVMPGATTGAVAVTTVGGTATGLGNFNVTPPQYPSTQQGAKLVGTGSVGVNVSQGRSISLSADGNTAIVGGPYDNGFMGAAWVYTRSGTTWSQQGAKLVGTGSVGLNVYQGSSVSLSADGNTAIVGGTGDDSNNGALWVFIRTGVIWTQQGSKLVGTGNIGAANQGSFVSLSADGNTALVTGVGDNSYQGAGWVFTRTGGIWTQQGSKLVGTGNTGGPAYQSPCSLSADGNTALMGGSYDDSNQGAAWVFTRTGSTWTQQGAKLVGTGNVGAAYQGGSVSLSADGNTAIVSGEADNSYQGAVWVFTRNGGAWSQQGPKLVGTGNVGNASQGCSVSVSPDGNTALIGGCNDDSQKGAVWVFTRIGGTWTQHGSKLVGTGNTGAAGQGCSVSLSADGNTALVGGYADNSNQGAVWVFTTNVNVQPPTITTFTPTSGSVGTLVTITGTNLTTPTTFTIGGANAIVISNTGTTLVGMVMPGAVTGMIAVTTTGGTANSTSSFTVIPTPYPSVQQGVKLVGSGAINGSNGAQQGYAVSISADGNTAIVGGNQDNSNAGAAWIYTRNGTTWSQQTKLVGTGGSANAGQGYAVSLSADGNTAIVGAPGDSSGRGAAWVFTRSGSTWSQQSAKLVGTGSVGNVVYQGISVSLSADGNTAIVGGYADNSQQGAAWVFIRSGSIWNQQGSKLIGTGNIGAATQGASVSLSADGNTAIVGGWADNSSQGAAWVFTRTGSIWTQQGAKLVGTGAINTPNPAQQGTSVALSADGNTAIVGGFQDNSNQGAAWMFIRTGSIWTQQGTKLVGTGSIGSYFSQGISVSLSVDGNTAIVGGSDDNSQQGATWVFTRSGTTWTQQGAKLVGTGNVGAAQQGFAVSLSADGNTVIVGGYGDNSNHGAAWIFTSSLLAPVKLLSFTGERQGTNNLLHWATASEQNNKGFELQRAVPSNSPPAAEALLPFATIAFVNTKATQGNSTGELKYQYTDQSPLTTGSYYRLKQVDFDGKFTYSNVVFIKGEPFTELALSALFPNPTRQLLNLIFQSPKAQQVQIIIADIAGKTLRQQTLQLQKGENNKTVNVAALQQGSYIIKVICADDCEAAVNKFVKE